MSFPILFFFWASSSSLPRSLHSGAQHQSVGAAVRPIALIKSSTITDSLFKIPNPGLPPRWICLSRPHNLHFMRRCSTSSTTPHSGHILSLLPSAVLLAFFQSLVGLSGCHPSLIGLGCFLSLLPVEPCLHDTNLNTLSIQTPRPGQGPRIVRTYFKKRLANHDRS